MSGRRLVSDLRSAADADLVATCVAGRREAFDVLVERYRRRIYQLCYRFAGNHEDARDLSQDVFVRAYRGLGRFRGRSSLGTWLYRIGVNLCLSWVTAKAPITEPLHADRHVDEGREDPAEAMVRAERAALVRAAILRLPRRQRLVLVLRVYQDLPHEEIAAIVGSSVGAVKANFCHALASLRRALPRDDIGAAGPGNGRRR